MGTKCERCRKTFWLVECRKRHPHAILLGYRMGFLFVVGVFLLPSPTCRKLTQNRLNLLRQNATLTALFSPTPQQLCFTLLNCFFTHFQTLCSPFFLSLLSSGWEQSNACRRQKGAAGNEKSNSKQRKEEKNESRNPQERFEQLSQFHLPEILLIFLTPSTAWSGSIEFSSLPCTFRWCWLILYLQQLFCVRSHIIHSWTFQSIFTTLELHSHLCVSDEFSTLLFFYFCFLCLFFTFTVFSLEISNPLKCTISRLTRNRLMASWKTFTKKNTSIHQEKETSNDEICESFSTRI